MPEAAHGRVRLALAHPAAADCLLDLAIRLAQRRQLSLHALVHEPAELTTAGALPFVHEIDRLSGARRAFDAAAAARAVARLAADCERCLRERAAAERIDLVVEVVSGPLLARALGGSAGQDLVLLGSHAAWAVPPARGRATALGRIAVVSDDAVDEPLVQALAADMAGPHAAAPTVPASGGTSGFGTDVPLQFDVLVVSRQRALAEQAALRAFLGAPRRVVAVLP